MKYAGNANSDTGTFAWLSETFHNILCLVFLCYNSLKNVSFFFSFVIYTYNWKNSIWRPVRLFHICMNTHLFLFISLFRLVIIVSYKCIYVFDCIHVRQFYFAVYAHIYQLANCQLVYPWSFVFFWSYPLNLIVNVFLAKRTDMRVGGLL